MSEILSSISSFVSEAISWITQFATTITNTPILLVFVITSFVGLGVGLIRRLIRL